MQSHNVVSTSPQALWHYFLHVAQGSVIMDGMSQMHDVDELEFVLTDRLLKSLRVAGMNATSMGAAIGVHRNTVNNYLSGRSPIERRTLIAWAFATGVPVGWLETGEYSTDPKGGPNGGVPVTSR